MRENNTKYQGFSVQDGECFDENYTLGKRPFIVHVPASVESDGREIKLPLTESDMNGLTFDEATDYLLTQVLSVYDDIEYVGIIVATLVSEILDQVLNGKYVKNDPHAHLVDRPNTRKHFAHETDRHLNGIADFVTGRVRLSFVETS